MSKSVEFGPYQEWKNHATWSVYHWICQQDPEVLLHYRQMARDYMPRTLKNDMASNFEAYLKGWYGPKSLEACIVKEWLYLGIRSIEWDFVYDLLRGKEIEWIPHELTVSAVTMIKQAPWQDVVTGIEFDRETNNRLRRWMQGQVNMWLNNITARQNEQTPLSVFVMKLYRVALESVDWKQIVDELRKE